MFFLIQFDLLQKSFNKNNSSGAFTDEIVLLSSSRSSRGFLFRDRRGSSLDLHLNGKLLETNLDLC